MSWTRHLARTHAMRSSFVMLRRLHARRLPRARAFSSRTDLVDVWSKVDLTRLTEDEVRLLYLGTSAAIPELKARTLVALANAMARSNARYTQSWAGLWRELDQAARPQLPHLAASELAVLAQTFVAAGCRAPSLFDAIAREAPRQLDGPRPVPPQSLTSLAHSFAFAAHSAPALFDAVGCATAARIADFRPPELSTVMWSLAAADADCPTLVGGDELAAALARTTRDDGWDTADLCRMHQYQLWTGERSSGSSGGSHSSGSASASAVAAPAPLPPSLRQACLDAFGGSPAHPSLLQQQVGAAFEAMGLETQHEVMLPQG